MGCDLSANLKFHLLLLLLLRLLHILQLFLLLPLLKGTFAAVYAFKSFQSEQWMAADDELGL